MAEDTSAAEGHEGSLEVTVAGVPSNASEDDLTGFFNGAVLAATGIEPLEVCAQVLPCVGCTLNVHTAVLRFSTADHARNALLFDGIEFKGNVLSLTRTAASAPDAPDDLCAKLDRVAARWYERPLRPELGARKGDLRGGEKRFYEVLDVPLCATAEEIRAAYLRLARSCHPDKSTEVGLFYPIREAYKILSDPKRRRSHDLLLLLRKAAADKKDWRLAAFLLKHLSQGFFGEGFRRVVMPQRHSKCFLQAAKLVKLRSGADILVRNGEGEVLVAGSLQSVATAVGLLQDCADEADGRKVTQNGVVIHVPADVMTRFQGRPCIDEEALRQISVQTGCTVTLFEERVVIQGGGKVPLAVASAQKHLSWKGLVQLFDGTRRDAWAYAVLAERISCTPSMELLPQTEPDQQAVWNVIRLSQGNLRTFTGDSLGNASYELLKGLHQGEIHKSMALVRCLASDVVCAGVVLLERQTQASYVVTMLRHWSQKSLHSSLIGKDFLRHALVQVLWELPGFLLGQGGSASRLLGTEKLRQAFQLAPQLTFLPWPALLTPEAPVHAFLFELFRPRTSDMSWCSFAEVASFVLEYCVSSTEFSVRSDGVSASQTAASSAAARWAEATHWAKPTTGNEFAPPGAVAKSAPSSKAKASPSKSAEPSAPPKSFSAESNSGATLLRPPPRRRDRSLSSTLPSSCSFSSEKRKGSRRKSGRKTRERRDRHRSSRKRRRPRGEEKDSKGDGKLREEVSKLRPSCVPDLSSDSAARFFRSLVSSARPVARRRRDGSDGGGPTDPAAARGPVSGSSEGALCSELLSHLARQANSSVDAMRELMKPIKALEALESIVCLEQQGPAESWDQTALVLLIHAAANELLDEDGSGGVQDLLACVLKPPLAACVMREDCLLVHSSCSRLKSQLRGRGATPFHNLVKASQAWMQLAELLVGLPQVHADEVRQSLLCAAKVVTAGDCRLPASLVVTIEDLLRLVQATAMCVKEKERSAGQKERKQTSGEISEDPEEVFAAALDVLLQHLLPLLPGGSSSTDQVDVLRDLSSNQVSRLAAVAECLAGIGVAADKVTQVVHSIAQASERRSRSGADWDAAELWQVIRRVHKLGFLGAMEGTLRALQSWDLLGRYAAEAPSSAAVAVSALAVRLDLPQLLRPLASRLTSGTDPGANADTVASFGLHELVAMLDGWPPDSGSGSEDWLSLASFRRRLASQAVTAAIQAGYGELTAVEARALLGVVAEQDQKALLEKSPAMLMVVEGLTVSELTQIIGKLGTSALHMGRVCAARLVRLGGSESASESGGCNVRELILAVRALHSAGLLSALPGTVADLASLEILHNAAGSERCNDDVNLSELIGLLLCEPVLEPSVLRLAELLAGVPRSRRGSVLSGSLPSPSLLVRCEGAGAPQVAECMAGVYAATGERCHGLPVHERVWPPQSESQLPVRIYFWDAGAGDAAWWLGPETGGDLVWARSKALRQRPDRPPRRNWTLLQKNLVNLVIKVLACESPTASPGQHQVLQEEHRAAAPAEQSDGVDVVATPLPPPSRSRSRSREATSVASVGTYVAQKRFGAEDWEEWLRTLGPNPAPLMCYASSLAAEFDDLVQVAAFKRQGQKGTLDQVDPCFFKAVGVKTVGHKMLFAKGILKLQ